MRIATGWGEFGTITKAKVARRGEEKATNEQATIMVSLINGLVIGPVEVSFENIRKPGSIENWKSFYRKKLCDQVMLEVRKLLKSEYGLEGRLYYGKLLFGY